MNFSTGMEGGCLLAIDRDAKKISARRNVNGIRLIRAFRADDRCADVVLRAEGPFARAVREKRVETIVERANVNRAVLAHGRAADPAALTPKRREPDRKSTRL